MQSNATTATVHAATLAEMNDYASATVTFDNFAEKLSSYAIHQSNKEDERQRGTAWKCAMLRIAAKMTDEAKIAADLRVVSVLSGKYDVLATPSDKAGYSGFTFEKDSAPAKALQRARALMRPTSAAEAREAIAKLVQFSARAKAAKAVTKAYKGDKAAAVAEMLSNWLVANNATAADCTAALPLIMKAIKDYTASL